MAPDVNSLPPSPHPTSTASSRRPSQPMGPPSVPQLSSPAGLSAVTSQPVLPPGMSVAYARGDNTGVGAGPGPLRHPRPLTAAELHLQLEKEQEAVVNRLTRELSLLRAQSASVASTTSSTSNGVSDQTDVNTHLLSGPNHPAPSQRRHHRSSSSTSARSTTTPATTASGLGGSVSHASAIAPPRPSAERARGSLSRQNSVTSSRRSGASSPAPVAQSPHHQEHFPQHHHRHSHQSHHALPQEGGPTSPPSTAVARHEDAAFQRAELEAVKRENETLRRRIRDLERVVAGSGGGVRRQSMQSASERGRSVSGSGTGAAGAARRRAGEREGGEGDGDVRVGESAGSVGMGGGN
ncbi:MAG: hypothetical protein M1832_004353 [Thelocarpon impressellum]|nr:MAG: hypothetical protein M1832_004353 [Thelocarpon impressellum]